MADCEQTIHPEDLEEFIQETFSDDLLYAIGDDEGAAGLCPYISFYVQHAAEQSTEVAQRMMSLCRTFSALASPAFQMLREGDDLRWHPCQSSDLPAMLLARQDHGYQFEATDKTLSGDSARWAIAVNVTHDPTRFSYLKLTFRLHWYLRNSATWHRFVRDGIAKLQPEHCYSGFELGNGGFTSPPSPWQQRLERACATRLLGMDIDHPAHMAQHSLKHGDGRLRPTGLGKGLRTPTWCFLLSPRWLTRLGKAPQDVAAALAHPDIAIDAVPYASAGDGTLTGSALWIRLGQLNAYEASGTAPVLPALASQLLRPLLLAGPELFGTNERENNLNAAEAGRWLRRFDDGESN